MRINCSGARMLSDHASPETTNLAKDSFDITADFSLLAIATATSEKRGCPES